MLPLVPNVFYAKTMMLYGDSTSCPTGGRGWETDQGLLDNTVLLKHLILK